jgi:hypothetical protein
MKIILHGVRVTPENGGWVHAHVERPDGMHIQHSFPVDTLEWRAAEYDIDPADLDTLLDVVLAELHLTDLTPGEDVTHPNGLFNAPDIETAREHHLTRCGAVEVVGADAHVWDRVKRHAVMHPEALDLKRQHVARERARVAVPHDRIAHLRQTLDILES